MLSSSSSSSSSSDRVNSSGLFHQPGMPTMGGPGPFSADAERGTVANLLYLRLVWAAWASAPDRVKAVTGSYCRDLVQCTMSRSMIIKSRHMTEQ